MPRNERTSSDGWTDEAAIRQWETLSRDLLDAMAEDGDLPKGHLINPVVLRMVSDALGDVSGKRLLDAGCGNGYLARMLAARGADVVGLEPAEKLIGYAREMEAEQPRGIAYVKASLTALAGSMELSEPTASDVPSLGDPFDAVVCSMVLQAIPSWRRAMAACVRTLRPGGLFVFSVNHPAFEDLATTWQRHGEYRVARYLQEYEMPQKYAVDWHRPVSAYLNEVARLGCRITEVAEPGLEPAVARAEAHDAGLQAYVDLPNFLIVASEAGDPPGTVG